MEGLVSSRSAPLPVSGHAAPARRSGSLVSWFGQFLRQELAPYPGRTSQAARMVVSVTLTMLVIETFHLPAGILGAFYALIVSRESLRSTARQAWLIVAVFALSTLYVLLSVALLLDSPVTHFLWVIGSFYLIFFLMDVARNYQLAVGFAFLIASAIPIWDRAGDVNLKVSLTLYTLLSVAIGMVCVLAVELVYRSFGPRDPVIAGIADRLHVTAAAMRAVAEASTVPKAAEARLWQYAMVGTSVLRRSLIRAAQSPETRARATAVVSITGRAVELCATMMPRLHGPAALGVEEKRRCFAVAAQLERLAQTIGSMQDAVAIGTGRLPPWRGAETPSAAMPALQHLEHSIRAMSEIIDAADPAPAPAARPPAERLHGIRKELATLLGLRPSQLFVADAFTNRTHLVFGLRGCIAATLCYLIYNGVDWPSINTSVATCIVTALGTIGSSRQKQLLRMAGAIVGGFLIALPAQVYLLPEISSISAFTLFFALVTAFAAWFATSSPRLSYFGLQVAFAFYLVNVQEPFEQLSLSVARDRVVGVLLGLTAMWITFDRIGSATASEQMGRLLKTNLELLGEMAAQVAAARLRHTPETDARFRSLRDRVSDTFSQMNAQADAVQFEWGRKRALQLERRERMKAMQPAMRSLFLMEITLYASEQLPRYARPAIDVRSAEGLKEFLRHVRQALLEIAHGHDEQTRGALARAHAAQPALRGAALLGLTESMLGALDELEHAATGEHAAMLEV